MVRRTNPTDDQNLEQWEMYNVQPKERRINIISSTEAIYGTAPSGAHEAEPLWLIWKETTDTEGRIDKVWAQEGLNTLRWIYNSIAFDPVPDPDGLPYDIQLDNQVVFDGMVAALPVANITASDIDDVAFTFTIIQDVSNKFSISGAVLLTTDTMNLVDIAYAVKIRATDDDNNSYEEWFTIDVEPLVPVVPDPAGLVTIVAIDDATWTLLPATALPNRDSLAVQNTEAFDIEVKHSDSGAYGTGVLMIPGDERDYSGFTVDHQLYARAAAGQSGTVRVEEITK